MDDRIAIGNFADARSLTPGYVDVVLCLKPYCCNELNDAFDVYCVPLSDGAGNRLELVNRAVAIIHSTVESGDRILVHCHAGRSRSVCIVAKYFCLHKQLSPREAIARINRVRAIKLTSGIADILNA